MTANDYFEERQDGHTSAAFYALFASIKAALRMDQPETRTFAVLVDKFNALTFQGGLNNYKCRAAHLIPALQSENRRRRNIRKYGQISDTEVQCHSRHFYLDRS